MIPLLQSTAGQEIPLGYFLDSTNGDTEETGLTIANTDIKLWKNGATTLANKNSGGATHISNGIYYCVLDATDTNTLGGMVVFVHVSGALSVKVECEVMATNAFNTLYGTDMFQTDLRQVGGSTQSATDLKDFADAGYNPTTNKVTGVLLTDTCTTNTDMVGTNSAALAATALTDATWTDAKAAFLDASIAGLNNISAANVNAEVVDVMKTDTTSEPSQGNPPATPTFEEMLKYVYFRMMNKNEETATEHSVYDAAGTTKVIKATVSDAAGTVTKGKFASGA